MHQALRVLRHLFVLTLASFFLLAAMCTRPVEPAKPAVSQALKDSAVAARDTVAEPLLLEFNIPGIPKENVVIDQKQRTITITLPPTVPSTELVATAKTTSGYYVNAHNQYGFRICSTILDIPRLFREKDDTYTEVEYKLILKRGGDVTINDAKAPYDYVAGTMLPLTAENLYGFDEPFTFIATHKQSGTSYNGFAYLQCQPNVPNVVNARFLPNVPAGEYTLTVEMKSGRRIQVAQPLIIKAGLPVIHTYYSYNPPAPGQQDITFGGFNLYEADHIEFQFRNGNGNQYRITPKKYDLEGTTVTVDLPATIPPSQYHVQLIRNGKLEPAYSRFLIQTPDRRQPQIVYIRDEQYNSLVEGDREKPISIRREAKYWFNYVLNQWSKTVRIRLTSKTDDTKTYLIDTAQKDIDAYNLYGPGIGRPWFIVPASIAGGRYQLSLQFTDAKGNVFEGDPLERDIDLQ